MSFSGRVSLSVRSRLCYPSHSHKQMAGHQDWDPQHCHDVAERWTSQGTLTLYNPTYLIYLVYTPYTLFKQTSSSY